jgi:hypothetical protein
LEKSVEAYQKRVDMGGWEEEVYYSMYMIAKIKEKIGTPDDEIISLYSKAWEYRPNRLECAFHVMRKLRAQNEETMIKLREIIGKFPEPPTSVPSISLTPTNYSKMSSAINVVSSGWSSLKGLGNSFLFGSGKR